MFDLGALLGAMTPRNLPALPATSVAPRPDAADRDRAILDGMARIRDQAPASDSRDTFFALLAGVTMDMKDVDGMPYQEANAIFRAAMLRAQARLDALGTAPGGLISDHAAARSTVAVVGPAGAATSAVAAARPAAAFGADVLSLGAGAGSRLAAWHLARQAGRA